MTIELLYGEVIRPVPGYEAYYAVSSHGRVFSLNYRRSGQMKELAQSVLVDRRRSSETFYRRAKMFKIDKSSPVAIHRLVALAFIPNPAGLPMVNHIDGDKGNNRASNLEWCSVAHNARHAEDAGLSNHPVGQDHGMAVLTDDQVRRIKNRLREEGVYRGQLDDVARDFGVSKHCIFDIRSGRAWGHIA